MVDKHQLDVDQADTFLTLVHHILQVELFKKGLKPRPKQMIFYLGGEGGTGKSKVVKALTDYLTQMGLRHVLRIAAPTGAAADNIGGTTLHSLLKLVWKKKNPKDKKKVIPYIHNHINPTYTNLPRNNLHS